MIYEKKYPPPRAKKDAPLVSLIIPVYGAPDYIQECLDSVAAQDLSRAEVLLASDHADEKSLRIARAFAKQHTGTQLIEYSTNVGVAVVRNEMVKRAQGTYIFFMDNDDYIAHGMLEKICTLAAMHDADAVCYPILCYHDKRKKVYEKSFFKVDIPLRTSVFFEDYPARIADKPYYYLFVFPNLCFMRLYKKSALAEVHFLENNIYEDLPFMFDAVFHTRRVVFLNDARYAYYYRTHRAGSISYASRRGQNKLTDIITSTRAVIATFARFAPTLIAYARALQFFHLSIYVFKFNAPDDTKKMLRSEIKKLLQHSSARDYLLYLRILATAVYYRFKRRDALLLPCKFLWYVIWLPLWRWIRRLWAKK